MNDIEPTTSRPPQGGPPLLAVALPYAVFTLAGLFLGFGLVRPDDPPAEVARLLLENRTAATVLAAAVVAAAVPLAIWSATAYRRLRRLGVTAPGSAIAFAGGILASASLALSGLVSWTAATTAPVMTPEILRALTTLGFAAGGPGFVPFFALLMAGVAVPGLLLGVLPRVWAWAGLVVAAVGMLSVFSLLTPVLYPLLPVGRFGGLIWLVAASVLLPQSRPHRAARRPERSTSIPEPDRG
jgi:hypothetical protein